MLVCSRISTEGWYVLGGDRVRLHSTDQSYHFSDLAQGGVLFRDIRELLADHFRCNKIQYIPRSCNSYAHEIAKLALSWDPGQSFLWDDPLPDFVSTLVSRDFIEISSMNERP